jgi:uncharacterized damage-inducible protein DinB
MKSYFLRLFRFNDWANQRLLITIKNHQVQDEKILTLMSHIISAEIIWLNRIKNLPTSPFPLWEKYKLSELLTMNMESSNNWLNFVEANRSESFSEMIDYKNIEGKSFETLLQDIMIHVVNHGTHHRSQVSNILKEKGIDSPPLDFIVFTRM